MLAAAARSRFWLILSMVFPVVLLGRPDRPAADPTVEVSAGGGCRAVAGASVRACGAFRHVRQRFGILGCFGFGGQCAHRGACGVPGGAGEDFGQQARMLFLLLLRARERRLAGLDEAGGVVTD